jgi:hypothetical protein
MKRLVVLAWLGAACAGSTIGSGVGDRLVVRPPYSAGDEVAPECVASFPIGYQRGASQTGMFDPADSVVAPLIAEMNQYLGALALSRPVSTTGQPGQAPDVRFGCDRDGDGECERDEDHNVEAPALVLSVTRAGDPWKRWLGATLETAGAQAALIITLEVGQYWARQRDLLGRKEVRLGSGGHVQELPWLTSLDAPVQVLQLTGALVGPDGRAQRIAAEGLLARRTNIVLSGLGTQALIRPEDVERLRSERRTDLPGDPLVWQEALKALVRELGMRSPHGRSCRGSSDQ